MNEVQSSALVLKVQTTSIISRSDCLASDARKWNSESVLHLRGKHKVLSALCIFAVGLIPPLFSMWMLRRIEAQTQIKLREAMRVRGHFTPLPEQHYLEGVSYLIGDISCRFNARSNYLRCAVNPQGPCQSCRHYESVEKH